MNRRDLDKEAQIVAFIDSEDYTLKDVGDMYGVTRERVRQIYKNATGKGAAARRAKIRTIKLAEEEAFLDQPKYNCASCGEAVSRREKHLRKYCRGCTMLFSLGGRSSKDRRRCAQCDEEFYPFRNMNARSQRKTHTGTYCSKKCYLSSPNAMTKKRGLITCKECGLQVVGWAGRQKYCKECLPERLVTYYYNRHQNNKLKTKT